MERNNQTQRPKQKRQRVKRERIIRGHKRSKEPVDYGVTKDQFYEIIDKHRNLSRSLNLTQKSSKNNS
jgi:hypothetical protein